MKKTLIGLLVALMAVSSFGGLVASWSAWGILDGANGVDGVGPYLFSETADTDSAIWDLVYTTKGSDTYGDISFDASTGEYSYADGDVVLCQRVSDGSAAWTQDGITFEADEYGIPGAGPNGESTDYVGLSLTYTEGNLYAAIFQYTSGGDVYYALSPLQTVVNWNNDGMGTGDEVHFNLDGAETDTVLRKLGTIEPGPGPIPEPATMSLLGLGALAMVLRRKLRK